MLFIVTAEVSRWTFGETDRGIVIHPVEASDGNEAERKFREYYNEVDAYGVQIYGVEKLSVFETIL